MNAKYKLEPSMKIIPHFDEDGKAAGTEIIILIRTLDPSKPLEIEA